jgi:hypothetical protein
MPKGWMPSIPFDPFATSSISHSMPAATVLYFTGNSLGLQPKGRGRCTEAGAG